MNPGQTYSSAAAARRSAISSSTRERPSGFARRIASCARLIAASISFCKGFGLGAASTARNAAFTTKLFTERCSRFAASEMVLCCSGVTLTPSGFFTGRASTLMYTFCLHFIYFATQDAPASALIREGRRDCLALGAVVGAVAAGPGNLFRGPTVYRRQESGCRFRSVGPRQEPRAQSLSARRKRRS